MDGVVAGKYRIEERIGAGGMGEVFAARDEQLHRRVAVKALLPSAAGEPVARARFIRETRLACRVNHPYVATVYDVLEHDERVLLVMEYIEGRPLARVLVHEDPTTAEAARWLLEIGEALAAIHRAGLVHRDLKPGNVMITTDRHVKLVDFGLARLVEAPAPDDSTRTADPSLTASGAVLGTLLYMSPEQLRGERVDQRSDQFSFGVLAWQVLAGAHPFMRDTMHESATAILREPPSAAEPTSALVQSAETSGVLRRMLEKDPERRYPDSAAMLAALGHALETLGAVPVPKPQPWKWAVAGVVALALVAAVVAGGYWWLGRPPEWDGPRTSLAIAPFEDRTGAPDGPLKAATLTELLTADLQGSRLVRVEGPAEMRSVLAGLLPAADSRDLVLRVATARAVDYVMTGQLFDEKGILLATVLIEPAKPGMPELPALRATGANPKELAERLAGRLRRQLPGVPRLTAYRDDRVDLASITSASEDARLEHERGLLALREERLQEAIAAFERAVAIDAGFALAHAHLAEALDRAGFGRRAREAAERSRRLAPAPDDLAHQRLQLVIEAAWAEVFGRTEDAVVATEKLVDLFPDEPALLGRLARALRRANRYAEAIEWIDRAVVLDPRNPSLRLERAALLRQTSQYDEALAAVEDAETSFKLVRSQEGLASAELERGIVFHSREEPDAAKAALLRAAGAFDAAGRPLSAAAARLEIAGQQLEYGHLDDVEPWIDAAETIARDAGDLKLQCEAQGARAVLAYYRRDFDGAEVAYRAAIDLAQQLESSSLAAPNLANLSGLLVWRGRREHARPLLDETLRVGRELGREDIVQSALISSADVEYQLGNHDAAIRLGQELIAQVADPPKRFAVLGYLGLAAAFRERGRLADALANLDLAVGVAERLDLPHDLGRALLNRARVRAALGRHAEAAGDLERAEGLARDLPELALSCIRVRALHAGLTGDWRAALDRLRGDVDAGKNPLSLMVACEARLRIGPPAAAVDACARWVEQRELSAAERAEANTARARALFGAGREAEAIDAAFGAFDEAKRMGLLLSIAHAAAVLADAPSVNGAEREEIRREGLAALDAFVAAAPAVDHEALGRTEDVARLRRSLGRDD